MSLFCVATWSTRNEAHNPKQTLDRFILNDQKRREVSANVVFIQVFRQLQRSLKAQRRHGFMKIILQRGYSVFWTTHYLTYPNFKKEDKTYSYTLYQERAVFSKMKMDPAKRAKLKSQNAGDVSSLQWFFSQSVELMTDKVWLHCIRPMLLK